MSRVRAFAVFGFSVKVIYGKLIRLEMVGLLSKYFGFCLVIVVLFPVDFKGCMLKRALRLRGYILFEACSMNCNGMFQSKRRG